MNNYISPTDSFSRLSFARPRAFNPFVAFLALALVATAALLRAQTFDVIDGNNIDQVSSTGMVSIFATLPPSTPVGLAFDANGNVYATDHDIDQISMVTPAGVVTTFATLPGGSGPEGIVIDSSGNIYTADTGSGQISKITPGGMVSVFATLSSRAFGLAIDAAGNLYTTYYDASGLISKITSGGAVTPFASLAPGSGPFGLAFDALGNLYAADQNIDQISRITPLGTVSTFANLPGSSGPQGLAFDRNGNLYTSTVSGKILEISPDGLTVTTFASGILDPKLLAIVPEPATWVMLPIGGVLLLVCCRGKRRA